MNEVLFGTSKSVLPWTIINDKENEGSRSNDPWTVRNGILARDNLAGHRWISRSGCSGSSGDLCSQGVRWSLFLAQLSAGCTLWGGAREASLTFSWRILCRQHRSLRSAPLVSCRSISVSHTRMLSLVPSNSSLWLVKCYKRGRSHCVDGRTGVQADNRSLSAQGRGPGVPPRGPLSMQGDPCGVKEPGVWSWLWYQQAP